MNNQPTRLNAVLASQALDDLETLRHVFALPQLHYIDISRQERLAQMMARWPLLEELSQKSGSH